MAHMKHFLFVVPAIMLLGAGCFSKTQTPVSPVADTPLEQAAVTAPTPAPVATTTPAVAAPKPTTTTKPKTTTKTPTTTLQPNNVPVTTGPLTIYVSITDAGYNPQVVAVNVNDTVVWTNKGATNQTSTSDNQVWDSSNIFPGTSFSRKFNAPGSYAYHSNVGNFKGTIVVR